MPHPRKSLKTGASSESQAKRRPICLAFALPCQIAADEVAKRLECEELAPAFLRAEPSQSASKLDALQALRDFARASLARGAPGGNGA